MSDNNDWDIEFDVEENRSNNGIVKYYKIFTFIIFLIMAPFFLKTILSSPTDPNPRMSPSTIINAEDRSILYSKYRNEFFGLVKNSSLNFGLIDKLIKSGINIDTQDSDGKTALFYAVINKNESMVRHLLYKRADVTIKDNSDLSPIDYVDNSRDKRIYIQLFDAKIRKEFLENGEVAMNIAHSLDKQGNIISTKVNGHIY
jgi:hypothetical protein